MCSCSGTPPSTPRPSSAPSATPSSRRSPATGGGTPRFVAAARGAYVVDAAGREYVDLVASWGPAILGHAHPGVVGAVQRAAANGLSFGAPTEGEVELAELVSRRVVRDGRA